MILAERDIQTVCCDMLNCASLQICGDVHYSNEDGDVLIDDDDLPFRDDPSDLHYKPAAKR